MAKKSDVQEEVQGDETKAPGPKAGGKDKRWSDIDAEQKTDFEKMTDEQLKAKVSEIHLELQRLMNAKELDEDLQKARAAVNTASATYREQSKGAKLLTKYALFLLEARGKA